MISVEDWMPLVQIIVIAWTDAERQAVMCHQTTSGNYFHPFGSVQPCSGMTVASILWPVIWWMTSITKFYEIHNIFHLNSYIVQKKDPVTRIQNTWTLTIKTVPIMVEWTRLTLASHTSMPDSPLPIYGHQWDGKILLTALRFAQDRLPKIHNHSNMICILFISENYATSSNHRWGLIHSHTRTASHTLAIQAVGQDGLIFASKRCALNHNFVLNRTLIGRAIKRCHLSGVP